MAALGLALLTSCGSKGGGGDAVSVPSSSGDVWVVDANAGRQATPGAVLAFMQGLHTVVLDGDDIYAGMSRLKAQSKGGEGKVIQLAGGLEATLTPAGADTMELRFSSGETVPLKKRVEKK